MLTATDGTQQVITITIIDDAPPVITVIPGNDTVEQGQGSTWTDAEATADNGETVAATGSVNTNTVGSYTITYSATDLAGNVGTATRTVTVVDTTKPVITLVGGDVTIEVGENYTELGATFSDNYDTELITTIEDDVEYVKCW